MANLRYQFDCFPSLHTALPWALTITSWAFLPKLIRAGLVTCAAGSTAAAVGLGFHYGTDLIGGFAWAAIVVWLTHWTMRKRSSPGGREAAPVASVAQADEAVPTRMIR
jgi:membrane-associated phospholipid phosphatase